jgi:nucleoside-diphosphate-sugar epimerase
MRMWMKILVLGGTAFFGRLLVRLLLGNGHDVTIATRGQTPDDFGDAVTQIKVDRTNQDAMMEAFGKCYYDLVYNQICFILKMPKSPWKRLKPR